MRKRERQEGQEGGQGGGGGRRSMYIMFFSIQVTVNILNSRAKNCVVNIS
jgi:hypothetical protein